MKALVYQGNGVKEWTEAPDPQLVDATDAVMRVDAVTICGTDLHILKGDVPAVTPGRILGHEAVGTIVEVGAAVTGVRPGDRVLASCISGCGRCSYCRTGHYGQCRGGGGWILVRGGEQEMLLTRLRPLAWHDLADMAWLPFLEPVIRIEAYRKDDVYIVRAELPGIDPAKDVQVTADDGYLRLAVVRQDLLDSEQDARSEFRYGSFHRAVALPPGAKEESICATYADGILEVTMTVGEPVHISKVIPIAIGGGQPKPVKPVKKA